MVSVASENEWEIKVNSHILAGLFRNNPHCWQEQAWLKNASWSQSHHRICRLCLSASNVKCYTSGTQHFQAAETKGAQQVIFK